VSGELKETPLREVHLELGGRMVGFAGWDMPIRYGSILEEHQAVREAAGVFDISHMGQFFVEGGEAAGWLNGLLTNNVDNLEAGKGHYTFLLNDEGGIIDDLILYRLQGESFLLVVNAARSGEDFAWLKAHNKEGVVELQDRSEEMAGIAVQGPRSTDVYFRMMGGRTLPGRNGVDDFEMEGQRILVCRTGYTGEDGFELFCGAGGGSHWFRGALDDGARACGLGARDSLRLEMCYPLNGSDLSPERTPLEAGLGFFVDLEKEGFVGREALAAQKSNGLTERLAAVKCLEPGPPIRPGCAVLDREGHEVGRLTSGTLSPSLGVGIGLAYLPGETARVGTALAVEVRGRMIPAEVEKKPFYKKA
jgi:aminomethyltransferase|tara:strand:- start:154 stop:1242 length:1089 start_codon:yes stop_codon:yes gene_type:complete